MNETHNMGWVWLLLITATTFSFINLYLFSEFNREKKIEIREDIVLHFAGKAHDLKKDFNSEDA